MLERRHLMIQLLFFWEMDTALESCLFGLIERYCDEKPMTLQELREMKKHFSSFIAICQQHSIMCSRDQKRTYRLRIYIMQDTPVALADIFTCSTELRGTSGTLDLHLLRIGE